MKRAALIRYKDSMHFFVDIGDGTTDEGRWVERPKPVFPETICFALIDSVRDSAKDKMYLSAELSWLTQRSDEIVVLTF